MLHVELIQKDLKFDNKLTSRGAVVKLSENLYLSTLMLFRPNTWLTERLRVKLKDVATVF